MSDSPATLVEIVDAQRAWSESIFGSDPRTEGILKHIASEIEEVREDPFDLHEWIDLIILAIDGAWRSGHTSDEIVKGVLAKQAINRSRVFLRTHPDEPSFHVEES